MPLLSRNGKVKKSSNLQETIYNFGIPAYYSPVQRLATCPMAGQCAKGCYARSGPYNFSNVKDAYEARLVATLSDNFSDLMLAEIKPKLKTAIRKDKQLVIRIHDSGDFYSPEYVFKWLNVINELPNVHFYAYTKMVHYFKYRLDIPDNFTIINSYGGKLDHLIDVNNDRHSMVFDSLESLLQAGYDDASNDDTVAYKSVSGKIGLVYHGFKSKKWTTA